ncbi:MAG: formylglycine-generating enzyme family protein [Bacteroidia bacterium]|nr:formylglycine-generating enzyme family protein [Bacteroidia bacterium]
MRLLLCLFLLCAVAPLAAQPQGSPCDYSLLMRQGDVFYQEANYRAALKKYNAARICDPGQSAAVNAAIDRLFTAIEKQRDEAQRLRRVAEAALLAVEEATVQIVETLLRDAQADIYNFRYDEAFSKLHNAARLVQGKTPGSPLDLIRPEVGKSLMESAFFYAETGSFLPAAAELRLADSLLSGGKVSTWTKSIADTDTTLLPRFRETLSTLDSATYHRLRLRYYPDMVAVKGGTFWMGDKEGDDSERPEHSVTLSDFSIARTEVTFWQYNLYLEATGIKKLEELGPLSWGFNGDNPVVNVSWEDAVEYINWVNKQEGIAAEGYRLPTEAEWEYAAGGGLVDRDSEGRRKYEYAGSDVLELVGWFRDNSQNRTQPVGQKQANGLGLYDMSGNVWEWCSDWYGGYPESAQQDPPGPLKGSNRVLRGGGWSNPSGVCRVAIRYAGTPGARGSNGGFRVARQF